MNSGSDEYSSVVTGSLTLPSSVKDSLTSGASSSVARTFSIVLTGSSVDSVKVKSSSASLPKVEVSPGGVLESSS